MRTKKITITDEAYAILVGLKGPKDSFTDVIKRLVVEKSVLDLTGVLTSKEAAELRSKVRLIRSQSRERLAAPTRTIPTEREILAEIQSYRRERGKGRSHDPLELALSSKKFASINPEKVEKTSIREQAKTVKNRS